MGIGIKRKRILRVKIPSPSAEVDPVSYTHLSYRHSLWITAAVCIAVALVVLLIAYWLIIHYVGSPEIIYLS